MPTTTSHWDPADDPQHDIGPWHESPSSSRVSRYRFDYAAQALQVQWTNNKNAGYIYEGVTRDVFQNFSRAVSKGMAVNRVLNSFPYRPIDQEELDAPSNPNRKQLQSRVRS